MDSNNDKNLEDILVDAGLLTNENLEKIKHIQSSTGQKIEKLLLSEEVGTTGENKEKMQINANRMGVDFVDLENIPVNQNAISKVKPDVAKKYFVFPFDISNNMLHLAMQNPDDIFLIDEIKMFTEMEIKPFLADGRMINKAIDYFYNNKTEAPPQVTEYVVPTEVSSGPAGNINQSGTNKLKKIEDDKQAEQLKKLEQFKRSLNPNMSNVNIGAEITSQEPDTVITGEPDTVVPEISIPAGIEENIDALNNIDSLSGKDNYKTIYDDDEVNDVDSFIRNIVVKALYINATNVHIDELDDHLRVRYRVNGRLVKKDRRSGSYYSELLVKLKEMAELDPTKKNVPQKGRIRYDMNEEGNVYITVHMLPTPTGEKIMLRFGSLRTQFTFENIGFSRLEMSRINTMLDKGSGLILITGTEESGKSSTVSAIVKKLLENEVNIISIENKLEELMSKITQMEVNDNPFDNIYDYVKLAVDNDPDVLIVDTKIDYPTFKLLMNTALGGKLVILTESYGTVIDTIEGLLEKDEGFVIAAAINGIIAQRVIRRICPDCKGKLFWDKKKSGSISSPKGLTSCSKCNSTGYSGKIGVFEVFYMDSEFKNMITKDERMDLVKTKLKSDKSTFEENCVRLIVEEVTSIDEVIRLGFGNKLYDF